MVKALLTKLNFGFGLYSPFLTGCAKFRGKSIGFANVRHSKLDIETTLTGNLSHQIKVLLMYFANQGCLKT